MRLITVRNFIRFLAINTLFLPMYSMATESKDISKNIRDKEILTLDVAIKKALSQNADLSALKSRVDGEKEAIRAQSFLDDPKIGFMQEDTGNMDAKEPMRSWTVSQEIKFPTKYSAMKEMQTARWDTAQFTYLEKRLETRRKVVTLYYNFYVSNQIIDLLEAEKATLREIAALAISRRGTGLVTQQDEMKAHVEQTNLENDLLMALQERESMQAMLNTVMGEETTHEINLPSGMLAIPELSFSKEVLLQNANSKSQKLKEADAMVREAKAQKRLAELTYMPDFMVSFQKPFSGGSKRAYTLSLDVTVPLWFFEKQTSEVSSKSAFLAETEHTLTQTSRDLTAEKIALTSKVQTYRKLLKIYETSLIPQVETTLRSSQGAYRAGKATFIDLLDSERSLYGVRTAYYRIQAQYVEALVQLEQIMGISLSTISMGGNL